MLLPLDYRSEGEVGRLACLQSPRKFGKNLIGDILFVCSSATQPTCHIQYNSQLFRFFGKYISTSYFHFFFTDPSSSLPTPTTLWGSPLIPAVHHHTQYQKTNFYEHLLNIIASWELEWLPLHPSRGLDSDLHSILCPYTFIKPNC